MAGDLMTPYAHYAAKPLPCHVSLVAVMFWKPYPIHPSARAEIAKDMKALTAKAVISNSVDKYVAAISHTEWRTATFSVQYFEATEGGMDNDTFGNECSDIGAAITLLQLAKAHNDRRDWTIVCDVHTDVGSSEI